MFIACIVRKELRGGRVGGEGRERFLRMFPEVRAEKKNIFVHLKKSYLKYVSL